MSATVLSWILFAVLFILYTIIKLRNNNKNMYNETPCDDEKNKNFRPKYTKLVYNNRCVIDSSGDIICDYYDNLKKQPQLDEEEIKRVEEYMKKISGLDDVEAAYHKIIRDTLDWAIIQG